MDNVQLLKTREELVAAARSLRPLLAKNAEQAEKDRRLPDETFKALIDAGVLRTFVPRRFGGHEAGHRTYTEVCLELGRSGCAGSAWYGFILNMDDWLIGMMHPEVQETVWRDGPDSVVCCPLTPGPGFRISKEEGGVRISGEWGYVSGCLHADWAALGHPVTDDGGNIVSQAIALIPMSEAKIKDTWFVTGMAGTGSQTLVVEDVFVPDTFTFDWADPLNARFPHVPEDGYMYRADTAAIFLTCVLPPVVGMAQAALELTVERLTAKPKPLTYTFYGDATKSPSVQSSVARAAAMIDAAVLQVRTAADEIDERSRTGHQFATRAERHRNSMRSAYAVRQCQEAVSLLLDAQGASAFALSNPVQRIWRDLNTASRHGLNLAGLKEEIYGRSLLGAEEQQMTALA
ncbi:acyl-CoA dehydrogenase family protein [Streptomyces sp. NPDC008137]|uniref:acyl-CoA dehydrogenase family protein n=1 Tax=Streptomyces sp. NPDC008137 TaxID=3364813 RepID=UPI0036E02C97